MNDIHWDAVKEFYKDKFGIDGWVVEMYANLDILSLCVSGASNDTIVNFLEIPMEEVVKVLEDTFKFSGWEKDLPFNPYRLFCSYNGIISSVDHFVSFTMDVAIELAKSGNFVNQEKVFYMCETYKDIEERIEDEWI